jgi:NAD(P)-dependent dehydrogenase (short-subunit alcohol dehydrogenase family)
LIYSRELAMVHARENIRVNALCPGPLYTPLLMDFLNTEEKRQRRLIHLPMGRFGKYKLPIIIIIIHIYILLIIIITLNNR